jgi:inorganic pyrophosphatase
MSRNGSRNGLADPSLLKPLDEDDEEIFNVVIETPKGCRNKYAFDQGKRAFRLKKVLPAGMTFPYDFGFVPSTEADDGDPVDVLVLMDEPAFTGCVVQCRLVGVIEGEQEEGKEAVRNDRLLAIENGNHAWAKIKHVDDLGKKFLKELEEFFVNYHRLSGKKYRVLDVKGPLAAQKCAQQGMKATRKR